jgi:hypothetical protein
VHVQCSICLAIIIELVITAFATREVINQDSVNR